MAVMNRDDLRYQAMMDRGGETAPCDWCVINGVARPNRGTDYHEIFRRGSTKKGSDARELIYAVELCSWLCNPCHIGLIHGRISARVAAVELIRFNIALYGYERVLAVVEAVQDSLIVALDFQFPEKETLAHDDRFHP